MATVIDALIVTLGLDGKAFAAGTKDALDKLKNTKDGSKRINTEMTAEEERGAKARGEIVKKEADAREAAGKRVALGLSQLRNQALALAAVFTAGMGIKNFVANTISNAAGLDRMSGTLGMSAKDLAAWRLAAENAGGTAEGMAAQLRESNEQVAKFKIGGVTDETNTFLQYGGKATDLQDGNRYLLARADILKKLYATDPAQAALVGGRMGISEDQFNFLRQGSDTVQAAVKGQEELAAAMGAAAAPAERLRKQFNTFENTLASVSVRVLTALMPSLERIVRKLQEMGDWFVANKDRINSWVTSAVDGITKFIESTDKAAKSVGGWQNILIALAGLKILSIVTPLLSLATALTTIASSLGMIGGASGIAGVAAIGSLGVVVGGAALASYSKSTNDGEAETLAALEKPLTNSAAAQDTVRKLQAMGWTREQAIGVAANIKQESEFNHKAVGDGGKAYGIAQWHPDRQEKFKAAYGIDIKDSTFDQQLAFIDLELRTNEKRAGDKLRAATTPQEAAKVVSTHYERPKATEEEERRRAGIAGAIFGEIYRSEQGAAATGSMVSVAQDPARGKVDWGAMRASTSTTETTIGQIVVNTQATDARGIAQGMAGALSENPLVSQVNNGVN